jgi:hypothetical protein
MSCVFYDEKSVKTEKSEERKVKDSGGPFFPVDLFFVDFCGFLDRVQRVSKSW